MQEEDQLLKTANDGFLNTLRAKDELSRPLFYTSYAKDEITRPSGKFKREDFSAV